MTDTRTPEQRRRIMQAVRTENTGPEMAVRRLLHSMGYRYVLHPKALPGRPDLAFPARRKAVFVHGCFWHGCECKKGRLPKSGLGYWGPKVSANRERDAGKEAALRGMGWEVLAVWQHEVADLEAIRTRLVKFLGPSTKSDRFF